jgi:hypothetical protein
MIFARNQSTCRLFLNPDLIGVIRLDTIVLLSLDISCASNSHSIVLPVYLPEVHREIVFPGEDSFFKLLSAKKKGLCPRIKNFYGYGFRDGISRR